MPRYKKQRIFCEYVYPYIVRLCIGRNTRSCVMRYYMLEEYLRYTKQWNKEQLNHLDKVLSGRIKSNQSEKDFMSHMEIVFQVKNVISILMFDDKPSAFMFWKTMSKRISMEDCFGHTITKLQLSEWMKPMRLMTYSMENGFLAYMKYCERRFRIMETILSTGMENTSCAGIDMMVVIRRGHLHVMQWIKVEFPCVWGHFIHTSRNILINATASRKLEVVKWLADQLTIVDNICPIAALLGSSDILAWASAKKMKWSNAVWHNAGSGGCIELVEWMLSQRVCTSSSYKSMLLAAVAKNQIKFIEWFLGKGIPIFEQRKLLRFRPLTHLNGTSVSFSIQDSLPLLQLHTPFAIKEAQHIAASCGHVPLLAWLLHGFETRQFDHYLFVIAATKSHHNVLCWLLNNYTLNEEDSFTVLRILLNNQNKEMIQLILPFVSSRSRCRILKSARNDQCIKYLL